jgi:hypothetical protein
MEPMKALLVFCEGPHDVAFCRLIFKYFFDIKTVNWKFSEYPSPLNQIFQTSMQNHAAQDMSLDMAHKFFLPDRTLCDKSETLMVMLFNTGGKQKTENPRQFLADFLVLLEKAETFSDGADRFLAETKYLFVYDADHENTQDVFRFCRNTFSHIEDTHFINEDFVPVTDNAFAASMDSKAVYIWGDATSNRGTLEDILLPLFEAQTNELLNNAGKFVDNCFTWDLDNHEEIRKYAACSKRKKAIISSAGQGKRPGRPMSAIVDDNVLGSKQGFMADMSVKKFADFLSMFTDMESSKGESAGT